MIGASRQSDDPGLWGPGTCVPPHRITRERTVQLLTRVHALSPDRQRWLERMCLRSGIERRYTCVREFSCDLNETDVSNWATDGYDDLLGGLRGRMERYGKQVAPLALSAARAALDTAAAKPLEVSHLIWVTCTGFISPGPDLDLAEQLGLGPDVHRVQVGFMGCQAAVQGLRLADAICRSDREAAVLLVCAELCTLHFEGRRLGPRGGLEDAESLIVASLFGDGVAAALVSRKSFAVPPRLRLLRFASRRVPAGAGLLSWRLGEPAFRMGLRPELPGAIAEVVGGFSAQLQPRSVPGHLVGWAVHPGGRAVLDAVGEALDLEAAQLAPSRQVLAEYGNMSSPSLLFAVDRIPRETPAGVGLAFGPGLSLEGFTWACP